MYVRLAFESTKSTEYTLRKQDISVCSGACASNQGKVKESNVKGVKIWGVRDFLELFINTNNEPRIVS